MLRRGDLCGMGRRVRVVNEFSRRVGKERPPSHASSKVPLAGKSTDYGFLVIVGTFCTPSRAHFLSDGSVKQTDLVGAR